jgi:O-antigen/teichoic acid export membrane protein
MLQNNVLNSPQTINPPTQTTSNLLQALGKMGKATDLGKTSTKAGFHYLWGLVISTVISSLGTIFVANLLGSDAYGLYSIALTVPNLIVVFRDWGIHSAMTRYTAQYRAENRQPEIRSILISGIVFELVLGIVLTLISFFIAGYLATDVFNRPEIVTLIQIASISVLAGGIVNAATAAFTGTELTKYNSVMLIIQAVVKTVLIVALVIIGLGTTGAVIGFTLSSIAAAMVGAIFTMSIYRKIPKPFSLKLEIGEYLKEMLRYCMPLSVLTIISGFLAQFYVMLLPIFYADNSIIGNYNVALNFVVLISFFSLPITTMLFPAFSKLDIKKDKAALQNVFQYSVKYSTLIVVPVTTMVMCLSGPAVNTLFGNEYSSAPLFLALLSIHYLFTATGFLSIGNIINSQGQTNLNLKFTLLTAAIGFPMGYLLIMHFGVLGLIFTTIVAGIPSLILSIFWVKKHYDLTIDWVSSAKILSASAIAATLTYLLVSFTNFAPVIELLIGTVFFIVVLVAAFMLTRTLSVNDLNSLRSITGGLGPISRILSFVLDVIEKILLKLNLD